MDPKDDTYVIQLNRLHLSFKLNQFQILISLEMCNFWWFACGAGAHSKGFPIVSVKNLNKNLSEWIRICSNSLQQALIWQFSVSLQSRHICLEERRQHWRPLAHRYWKPIRKNHKDNEIIPTSLSELKPSTFLGIFRLDGWRPTQKPFKPYTNTS